jgi:hypothetical protein
MLNIPRGILGLFYESMKRIIADHRRLSVASVMFLLVGVVALSTATRRPCLRARSGAWHIYKASRMTEAQQKEISVTKAAEPAEVVVADAEASPPRYVPHEEMLPIGLPLALQKHHFRSPPLLQQTALFFA